MEDSLILAALLKVFVDDFQQLHGFRSRILQSGRAGRLPAVLVLPPSLSPLIEHSPQRAKVHVFFHLQTIKRRICNSAHPGFDALIGEVEKELFASTSRNVHDVLTRGLVNLEGLNCLHQSSSMQLKGRSQNRNSIQVICGAKVLFERNRNCLYGARGCDFV
jgi:hypothetical protein